MTTTTQIRDENYRDLVASGRLRECCVSVYAALRRMGEATTKELHEATGVGLLTVRPRVSRMCKDGLVRLVRKDGADGVYACADWVKPKSGRAAAARTEAPREHTQPTTTAPTFPGFEPLTRSWE